VGQIFAYEISQALAYKTSEVTTPFGISTMPILKDKIVITALVRSGLALQQGFLDFFDNAENGFVSIRRRVKEETKNQFEIEYMSTPSLDDKILILTDAMIATGASMVSAYKSLLENGTPLQTHIISIISSREGLELIRKKLPPKNIRFWLGALDDELTAKLYVVPGLGDAGDLAYGKRFYIRDDDEEAEEENDDE